MNLLWQLRDYLWRSKPVRHTYWALRRGLGIPTTEKNEILHRIYCRSRARNGHAGFFSFPWGSVQYLSAPNLRVQYEDIFLREQYAFKPLQENPVIVDCGGNIGMSALFFKLTYPSCRLTVYEADPEIATILSGNLARAGFSDVEVNAKAVWVRNERVVFDRRGTDRGTLDSRDGECIPAIDLAEALPPKVDLVKMDIEGAEYSVLSHLCRTGAIRRVRNLAVEYHVTELRTDAFLDQLKLLRALGFNLAIGGASTSLMNGVPQTPAPFQIIGDRAFLVTLYAWQETA